MENLQPFHVAVPVSDLDKTKDFYLDLLSCKIGRSSDRWVDLNFFGHQFVLHLDENKKVNHAHNPVDGHSVPIPHYGVVLQWDHWQNLAQKLKAANVDFIIEPYIRFEGQAGEQATMFFLDPSGNALEFKAFKDINQLFATD
jgi:extradiol dioxygenase family protein